MRGIVILLASLASQPSAAFNANVIWDSDNTNSSIVIEDIGIIVICEPHVGISATGKVGKYQRKGQEGRSTACWDCTGTYNACLGSRPFHFDLNEVDIQMGLSISPGLIAEPTFFGLLATGRFEGISISGFGYLAALMVIWDLDNTNSSILIEDFDIMSLPMAMATWASTGFGFLVTGYILETFISLPMALAAWGITGQEWFRLLTVILIFGILGMGAVMPLFLLTLGVRLPSEALSQISLGGSQSA